MKYTCGIFFISKDKKLLIAHPTNARRDQWSIPKGLKDQGEPSNLAAVRELEEETGIILSHKDIKTFTDGVIYKDKKKTLLPFVHKSDIFSWEFGNLVCSSMVNQPNRPPFPENDEFGWCSLEEAKTLIHYTQVECLENLEKYLIPKNISEVSKEL